MLDRLLLNTVVHLRFFVRSRLVWGLAVITVFVFIVSMLPALFMGTTVGRFDLLRMITLQTGSITLWLTSPLGLLAIAAHVRGRAVKLVLTKPCSPEVWLGSIFLAGVLVIGGLQLLVGAVTWAISAALGVPYQSGFAFLAIDAFLRATVWFSYVTALSLVFHPVLAVLLAIFVNEGAFFTLKSTLATADANGASGVLGAVAGGLVDACYMILPMTAPFSGKTAAIYSSLRTVRADWSVLLNVAGYTALATVFFYCLSTLLLRRKSLV
jgi:hypothetical protein